MKRRKRVLVAMSGGVDSSVTAGLLKDQGYDVVGMTMQVWDYSKSSNKEGHGTCCSSLDVQDARSVCAVLGIPFYVLNCEEIFEKTVIQPFIESYLQGRTPIPCTNCNSFLKFHHLIEKMKELDCDYLATGHYAKVRKLPSGEYGIFTGDDEWKDQTYFLFTLDPKIIPKLLFPIGDLTKDEVRKIAEHKGLPVFKKKDSTGICFIGQEGYKDFVEKHSYSKSLKKGQLRQYPTGEILGVHDGIHRFTVGQRKGLGVPSLKPLYVIAISSKTGDVWLGDGQDLYSTEAQVSQMNWLDQVFEGEELKVKIRFYHRGSEAKVYKNSKNECFIKFKEPQRAITPGQSAVFYRDRQLIGGGMIQEASKRIDEVHA